MLCIADNNVRYEHFDVNIILQYYKGILKKPLKDDLGAACYTTILQIEQFSGKRFFIGMLVRSKWARRPIEFGLSRGQEPIQRE